MDTQGQAWCWGYNTSGELGFNDSLGVYPTPRRVNQPAGVQFTQIVANRGATCALATTGQAYCWGYHVPVGTGVSTRSTPTPVPQPGGLTFSALSGLGRRQFGTVMACGIDSSGQPWCWGEDHFSATAVPAPAPFAQIAIGDQVLCARSTANQVYCRNGVNVFGADTFAVVTQPGVSFQWMDTNDAQTCAVSTIGQLFCWPPSAPTPAMVDHPASLRFSQVAVQDADLCAVSTTGQVYCRGSNDFGQLGDGTKVTKTALTPVSQPGGVLFSTVAASDYQSLGLSLPQHVCALRQTTGDVYCWGGNTNGQLGDGTTIDRSVPVPVYR